MCVITYTNHKYYYEHLLANVPKTLVIFITIIFLSRKYYPSSHIVSQHLTNQRMFRHMHNRKLIVDAGDAIAPRVAVILSGVGA